MVNPRSMNLGAVCSLGLALLVLCPWEASAQRFQPEDEDPLCYRTRNGVCEKIRVALIGGGILSTDHVSSALGMKAGVAWVMGPRMELGGSLLLVKDFERQDGPYLGTAEAIFRLATMTGPYHRLFLEFAAGASRYDSPEFSAWAFPCATAGASYELASPGIGIFGSAGLTLMWARGATALPHVGVGLAF
jgi:hypothetical protein